MLPTWDLYEVRHSPKTRVPMINNKKTIGRILGPLLFMLILLFFHPGDMEPSARYVLASTVWIAAWWVTEAIPIPMTSLLPLVFFPGMGVSKIAPVAEAYINPIIFLFIGGFMLALALEKWNLHRRIALTIIASVGANSQLIVMGFMIATGFLSMWISNTATTLMMVPIALAIVAQIYQHLPGKESENLLGKALMLAIAYSASIGGMATLVGTPTNLIFTGYVKEAYAVDISFDQWFVYGFPLSLMLMVVVWWYL
ncbi:MAG: anion permease, partial [Bacteroidetes bacterium]|nr:anion permease [Bacteroidota bacterium]